MENLLKVRVLGESKRKGGGALSDLYPEPMHRIWPPCWLLPINLTRNRIAYEQVFEHVSPTQIALLLFGQFVVLHALDFYHTMAVLEDLCCVGKWLRASV
jgi:hypothetical protein